MNPSFSPEQLTSLAKEYSSIRGIDPCSQHYQALTALLDRMPLHMLQQLAQANIRFISVLASNRVRRRNS